MRKVIRLLQSMLRRPGQAGAKAQADIERRVAQAWHSGEWERAIELARRALRRWPDSADLHFMMGACELEAGRPGEAALALRNAERLGQRHRLGHPIELMTELHLALAEARCVEGHADLPAVHLPARAALVSIIICSIDEARFQAVEADYRAHFEKQPHEIIRISDARSLSEGYNRGMRRARGDLLIFSHDDVRIVTPDFAERVVAHLQRVDLLGIAGTRFLSGTAWVNAGWPYLAGQVAMDSPVPGKINVTAYGAANVLATDMQALDGVFMAARRDVAERVGFDDAVFDGWHHYDLDFSFRASIEGFRVGVADDLMLVHASSGGYQSQDWELYSRRFLDKHAAQLTALGTSLQQVRCSILVNSEEEWRALTAARLARALRPRS